MKSTIWADDDYLKLAPINDELIKKAEEVLNVKLPESYITLLKEQNGELFVSMFTLLQSQILGQTITLMYLVYMVFLLMKMNLVF